MKRGPTRVPAGTSVAAAFAVVAMLALSGCPSGTPDFESVAPAWVEIPAGSFLMGASPGDDDADGDEVPSHEVAVAAFRMTATEVTVAQYRACLEARVCAPPETKNGCNWGAPGRDRHPANCVDWLQARTYCAWADGRLASEAEWEYAARAGTTAPRYGPLERIAWFEENSGGETHPVGTKEPNGLGLYDMLGNVAEWVEDCYHNTYAGAPTDGNAWTFPCGPGRVLRGASWWFRPHYVRASNRDHVEHTVRTNPIIGFRCAAD